jgi:hypothetical protein
MKFRFIDNNEAGDGAVRKQIRSHVAKGRNRGKKLSRPSRKTAFSNLSKTQPPVTEPLVQLPTDTTISVRLPRALSALPAHWKQHCDEGSGGFALFQRGKDIG